MTHAWCSDPSRDAAVRAAEDGRTSPLPTLEQAIVAPFACTSCGGFGMDHRCRESCEECAPTPQALDGMRTERVTLEINTFDVQPAKDWACWDAFAYKPGESVRVVEEPLSDAWAQRLNRLTAERDAAIRERDKLQARVAELEGCPWVPKAERDALQARVAELEAASGGGGHKVTEGDCLSTVRDAGGRPMPKGPAPGLVAKQAASGGNSTGQPYGSQAASGGGEPVAWMCEWTDHTSLHRLKTDAEDEANGDVVPQPLYRAPPQPRGWLTEEEREALESARLHLSNFDAFDEKTEQDARWASEIVAILLARSSPPEVVLPVADCSWCCDYATVWRECLEAVRSSLAKAGVAVKEVGCK